MVSTAVNRHRTHHPASRLPAACRHLTLLFGVLFSLALSAAPTAATDPASTADPVSAKEQQQAKLYRETLQAIRKGHRTNTEKGMRRLTGYPLYPYLEKAELSHRLHQLPGKEVDAFLDKYQGTVAAQQLQRRWLKVLAERRHWKQFLHYYDPDIAGIRLQCDYLQALHNSGYPQLALQQTSALWLSGKSMPDSCDPVFKRWREAGLKTDSLVWQRQQMALEQGNTRLARYLSKYASAELKPYTRRMLSVYRHPRRLARTADFKQHNQYTADIISRGLRRLASRDPDMASDLWERYRGDHNLSDAQNHLIRDKIARQLIASDDNDALNWLIAHDPNADDSYLLEWRIRLALKDRHWDQARHWIGMLPRDLQQQPRWRYWRARSEQHSDPEAAQALLEQLASERHYYGFLAAGLLGKDYDFNHDQLDTVAMNELREIPAIARARAFYDMNELTSARREWYDAVADFDQQQLVDATRLAYQWGWYQQAILTTIKAKQWDDLAIRFPLAYRQDMSKSAQQASIRLDWLYAITRQESAFAEDARSAADARGLMQLKPTTARQVARTMGMHIHTRDLYHADTNIALGSNYLKQLLDRFNGDHVLATAAYNAGPNKVNQWLKNQSGALPYDIWIETLPYQETRNYVQSVLAFSVIYSHRLGLEAALMRPQQEIQSAQYADSGN